MPPTIASLPRKSSTPRPVFRPVARRPAHKLRPNDACQDTSQRPRSPRLYVPDMPGWYGGAPVWQSEQRWLTAVIRWADSQPGQTACHGLVSADTLVRIARALAAYADHDTGRRCAPSQTTVAAVVGCARKTVQRAEHILTSAGLVAVVHGGGNYTHAMHVQHARLRRDGHQIVKAAHCPRVRALTLPPEHRPVGTVPLPACGRSGQSPHCGYNSPNARGSAREAAARPQPKQRKEGEWRRREPRPIGVQRLTAALIARLPWLGRNRHAGAVADALSWAGIHPQRWGSDAATAADALIAALTTTGPIPTGDSIRSPLGWLHHALARIDTDTATTFEQHQQARAAKQAQDRQWRADQAAQHAAAIPLDASSAAASIRQTLARARIATGRDPTPDLPVTTPGPRAWHT